MREAGDGRIYRKEVGGEETLCWEVLFGLRDAEVCVIRLDRAGSPDFDNQTNSTWEHSQKVGSSGQWRSGKKGRLFQ